MVPCGCFRHAGRPSQKGAKNADEAPLESPSVPIGGLLKHTPKVKKSTSVSTFIPLLRSYLYVKPNCKAFCQFRAHLSRSPGRCRQKQDEERMPVSRE